MTPPTTARMTFDLDEIRRAALALSGSGSVTEIRIPKTGQTGTVSGYFDDPDLLARAAANWSGKAAGIYVTLNPVHPALLARAANRLVTRAEHTTADSDILCRRWLLFDLDPKRPSGISSTEAEHEAAIALARQVRADLDVQGWPAPILADSGNGAHLLYRYDMPNDDDGRDLIERVLRAADWKYSDRAVSLDTSVYNAARITKLYGTLARKGDDTPERPHRIARILDLPGALEVVPVERLHELAATLPIVRTANAQAPRPGERFDLAALLAGQDLIGPNDWNTPSGRATIWKFRTCPWNPEHTDRSAWVARFQSGAIDAGCHHNGCQGKGWPELRDILDPGWRERRARTQERRNGRAAQLEADATPTVDLAPTVPMPEAPPDDPPTPCPDGNGATAPAATPQELDALLEAARIASEPERPAARQKLIEALASQDLMTVVDYAERAKDCGLGTKTEIREAVREATDKRRAGAKKARKEARPPTEGGLPAIKTNDRNLRDVSTDGLRALVRANRPPYLFVRSGSVVRVRTDERKRPLIDLVTDNILRHELGLSANWYVERQSDKAVITTRVSPPMDATRDILARKSLHLPALDGITETPVIRPDGSVLATPGYDAATRLIYMPAPGLTMPDIPEHPTAAQVQAARALLEEAIGEFPYADQASRANAYAVLLTPVARPAILGHVPLALINAPQAGTGKGLKSEVVAHITTGRSAAMMTAPREDEEFRKKITATLASGETLIFIDNVEYTLAAPSLAAAITADVWRDRILGTSQTITIPQRATWIATGNNILVAGDMARRCYEVRLDAQMSEPWRRTGFKHPNLLQWVSEHRGELIGALLTLARAWFAAGQPEANYPRLGSFEDWCRVIGGILALADIDGFLGNLEDLYARADNETGQWEPFLQAWHTAYGDTPKLVAEVYQDLELNAVTMTCNLPDLREALPDDLADSLAKKSSGFQRKLGNAIRRRENKRYGNDGWHIERDGSDPHSKTIKWTVSKSAGSAGSAESIQPQGAPKSKKNIYASTADPDSGAAESDPADSADSATVGLHQDDLIDLDTLQEMEDRWINN